MIFIDYINPYLIKEIKLDQNIYNDYLTYIKCLSNGNKITIYTENKVDIIECDNLDIYTNNYIQNNCLKNISSNEYKKKSDIKNKLSEYKYKDYDKYIIFYKNKWDFQDCYKEKNVVILVRNFEAVYDSDFIKGKLVRLYSLYNLIKESELFTKVIKNIKDIKSFEDIKSIKNKYINYSYFNEEIDSKYKEYLFESVCEKKSEIINSLSSIYANSNIIISSNLKKKINSREIKNIQNIKDIIDNFKNYTEEEFNNFIKSEKNNMFDKSEEEFLSYATLATWYDELENHSGLGILAEVKTGYLGKLGNAEFLFFNPRYDLYSIDDYLYSVKKILEVNNKWDFNKTVIVKDSLKNKCNAIFPLYINKYHWLSVKKYLPYVLSTVMSHSPLAYTEGHIKAYFIALLRYANNISNDKNAQIFLSVWRTCYEIAKDKNYLFGFSKLINNVKQFRYLSQYEIILGQSLLNDKLNIDKFYDLVLNEIVTDYLKKIVIEDITFETISDLKLYFTEILLDFCESWHFKNLIKSICIRNNFTLKQKTINTINELDKNYSVASEEQLKLFKNILSQENYNSEKEKLLNNYSDNYMFTKIYNILYKQNINESSIENIYLLIKQ